MLTFHQLSVHRISRKKGFSLLELIVAIAIFIALTSTLLFNYNSMNKRITLDTLSHQIAQWVREAQVYAMSVKRGQTLSGVEFPGYGLHFDIANPNEFIFFADSEYPPDQAYDPIPGGSKCGDSGVECKEIVKLPPGYSIDSLCGDAPSGSNASPKCYLPGAPDASSVFDIVFTRPNPDAVLSGDLGTSGVFPVPYSNIQVAVISPKGDRRIIEVWTTGQISVQ